MACSLKRTVETCCSHDAAGHTRALVRRNSKSVRASLFSSLHTARESVSQLRANRHHFMCSFRRSLLYQLKKNTIWTPCAVLLPSPWWCEQLIEHPARRMWPNPTTFAFCFLCLFVCFFFVPTSVTDLINVYPAAVVLNAIEHHPLRKCEAVDRDADLSVSRCIVRPFFAACCACVVKLLLKLSKENENDIWCTYSVFRFSVIQLSSCKSMWVDLCYY